MSNPIFNILLVEDNPDHAELIIRSFEEHDFVNSIRHVQDGEAALDYLLRRGDYTDPERSPVPHVILLDLRLPKVDGLEVLHTIKMREDLRRIPVVILTSSESERDLTRAYDHFANSYLVKPVDFDRFISLMHELGFYWLKWNRSL